MTCPLGALTDSDWSPKQNFNALSVDARKQSSGRYAISPWLMTSLSQFDSVPPMGKLNVSSEAEAFSATVLVRHWDSKPAQYSPMANLSRLERSLF
jgi:hypothetical protein